MSRFFKDKRVAIGFIGLVFITLGLVMILKLWGADLNVPFGYAGDYLSTSAVIKTVIDFGWYTLNPSLGTPYELNMNDYPMGGDNLNFLLIKIISLFSSDYALVTNIFYLLTFYLAFLSSLYVFCKLKFSCLYAIGGSLLFSFLPYHFFRGNGGHLLLTCYYGIPLVILVAHLIINDNLNFSLLKVRRDNRRIFFISLISSLIIASTGVYYAFFGAFLWLVSGLYVLINKKGVKSFINSLILVVFTSLILILNYLPTLIYKLTNPTNVEAAHRSFVESEIYGLKIIQILLPILGHRYSKFDALAQEYSNNAPLVNENYTVSLGILGSIGFLILLTFLFVRTKLNKGSLKTVQELSLLNIAAVLLSTIGGLGSLFALLITPSIRGYNRIIPYIAFMSLLALCFIVQLLHIKIKGKYNLLFSVVICIIVVLGILDQTSSNFAPQYNQLKAEYTQDNEFFEKIESKVIEGKIFQLPYIAFPESPPLYKMGGYEPLKAYLHTSTSLKWSYGAMRGSKEDLRIREISMKPINQMIEDLSLLGFSGILLDRLGYEDPSEIEDQITLITGNKPLISENERYYFVDMTNPINYNENELEEKMNGNLQPITITWGDGLYELEQDEDQNWRWANKTAVLIINNPSKKDRKVNIETELASSYSEESELKIESDIINKSIQINNVPTIFKENIVIPPGMQLLKFSSYAQRVNSPGDSREMYFRIQNFILTEIE